MGSVRSIISPAEMGRIRNNAKNTLLLLCSIARGTSALDLTGSPQKDVYSVLYTDVYCGFMEVNTDTEQIVGSVLRTPHKYMMRFTVDTDVKDTDRITIGDNTYEVIRVNEVQPLSVFKVATVYRGSA
jgi:hypothetical protein